MVNIQLPIYLGELIDKMAQIIKDQSKGMATDLNIIKPEAVKLVLCYTAQAVLTFCYITFLTVLGERMAADLRVKLFSRLLIMDMAFYDSQKTAELSARLNNDVQEFKSCFKLTVAQGLRTLTQESLVRRAQAQSAVAASVADEAFGNIRTVRAFAMEEQEARLFEREVRKACSMQELLGMGIGLFQGATNFFLNGIVLSVLYGGSSLIKEGKMTPGELMAFLVTAQTIQRSLSQLSLVFGTALKGWTAGARAFEFVNLHPTIRNDDGVCIPYHSLCGGRCASRM
ncbi:hypothetical protein COOONC_18414 [Cooperia oncophora]